MRRSAAAVVTMSLAVLHQRRARAIIPSRRARRAENNSCISSPCSSRNQAGRSHVRSRHPHGRWPPTRYARSGATCPVRAASTRRSRRVVSLASTSLPSAVIP